MLGTLSLVFSVGQGSTVLASCRSQDVSSPWAKQTSAPRAVFQLIHLPPMHPCTHLSSVYHLSLYHLSITYYLSHLSPVYLLPYVSSSYLPSINHLFTYITSHLLSVCRSIYHLSMYASICIFICIPFPPPTTAGLTKT